MAKLYLKFDQQLLKEVPLTPATLTIGRLPDNMLQIDNLAVSGHHAKVTWEADHYAIEDLGSLNGTYVNNQRVGKASLRDGDQVLIGKHVVQFKDETQIQEPAMPPKPIATIESTVVLDTRQAQEMLAAPPAAGPAPAAVAPKEKTAILSVLDGRTDQTQYVLTGKMTMIGKSNMASIRLKGLFAPNSAALISRREGKYFIAASEAKIKLRINGEEISGQRELIDGDIIEVASIKVAFGLQ